MQTFPILVILLLGSTAKESLSNFISILYPESFILCKKAVYNGLSLELYNPFNSHIRI